MVKISILYEESHKEPDFEKYYSILSRLLNQEWSVNVLKKSPLTVEKLKDQTVLIVSFPQLSFEEQEIDVIDDFVKEGGGLFLVGEEWNFNHFKNNLNNISQRFGVIFNDDEVLDPENRFLHSSNRLGDYYFTVKTKGDHPILEKLDEFVIYGGCSLRLNGSSKAIISGSEYSYSSEKYFNPGDFPPLLSTTEYGKGKVVCLGDGSLLRDSFINESNNKQLALNIINWIKKFDEPEEQVDEHIILEGIEQLEKKYSELDSMYSSHSITYDEYQRRIEEFGQELQVLESRLRLI